MKQRIYSGLALILGLLLVVLYANFEIFYIVFAVIAAISVWEYSKLLLAPGREFRSNKLKGLLVTFIALATAVPFAIMAQVAWMSDDPSRNIYALLSLYDKADKFLFYAVIVWIMSLIIYRKTDGLYQITPPWIVAVFAGMINAGFFFGVFILRYLDVQYATFGDASRFMMSFDTGKSPALFLFVILMVAAADSGAYFTGKAIGKTKMSPKISPNKTLEGLFGGLFSAAIVATIYVSFSEYTSMLSAARKVAFVVISVLAVAAAVHGDLFESFLKRRAEVKDSSNLIPGHGGVLDRLDSLQPAFAIFSYYWFFLILSDVFKF